MTNILNVLLRVEWSIRGESMTQCPICGNGMKYGHVTDCQLAQAIKEAGGKEVKMEKVEG